MLQCLFHCRPFRDDLGGQQLGASFLGDRAKALLTAYTDAQSTDTRVRARLAELLDQLLRQAGFAGGSQQDAAECLMHLFLSVDQGRMQARVCGASAVASVESMILCDVSDEAQVAADAPPVLASMIVASLTGDSAIAEAPRALVIRVENVYEHGGQYFAVDARADWAGFPVELTVREAPDLQPQYTVACFVSHISDRATDARRRMRSGHYIAYVQCEGHWFELNDDQVTALSAPPTRVPYLVFLVRTDARRRVRGKQSALTSDGRMLELLQQRAEQCAGVAAAAGSEPSQKRARIDVTESAGRRRNRTGREQDWTGRDQTG